MAESKLEITHSMAHYLLTIHNLKEEKGYARATDIAKELGFTKGSVSTALQALKKKDLLVEDDKHFFSLSKSAHEVVHEILSTRTLLFYFFKDFLGVGEKQAEADACQVEHLFSSETQKKLFEFMKKTASVKTCKIRATLSDGEYEFLSQFKNYGSFKNDQDSEFLLSGKRKK